MPAMLLGLLGNPAVRALAIAAALAAAVLFYGHWERGKGRAEARAEYEHAAAQEQAREVAAAQGVQEMFRQVLAEVGKTRESRSGTANQVRAAVREALGAAGCLDAGSVRGIDRVR